MQGTHLTCILLIFGNNLHRSCVTPQGSVETVHPTESPLYYTGALISHGPRQACCVLGRSPRFAGCRLGWEGWFRCRKLWPEKAERGRVPKPVFHSFSLYSRSTHPRNTVSPGRFHGIYRQEARLPLRTQRLRPRD